MDSDPDRRAELAAKPAARVSYATLPSCSNSPTKLVLDGQLYALGGSAKDARYRSDFAIGRIDPTPVHLQKVDDFASMTRVTKSSASEWIGPR